MKALETLFWRNWNVWGHLYQEAAVPPGLWDACRRKKHTKKPTGKGLLWGNTVWIPSIGSTVSTPLQRSQGKDRQGDTWRISLILKWIAGRCLLSADFRLHRGSISEMVIPYLDLKIQCWNKLIILSSSSQTPFQIFKIFLKISSNRRTVTLRRQSARVHHHTAKMTWACAVGAVHSFSLPRDRKQWEQYWHHHEVQNMYWTQAKQCLRQGKSCRVWPKKDAWFGKAPKYRGPQDGRGTDLD